MASNDVGTADTPDGQFFTEAVSMITSAPYPEDVDLLIEALKLAEVNSLPARSAQET